MFNVVNIIDIGLVFYEKIFLLEIVNWFLLIKVYIGYLNDWK